MMFDLATYHFGKTTSTQKKRKPCHSERSEEPLFEGLLNEEQRSFAVLRMTRKGIGWCIEDDFQK